MLIVVAQKEAKQKERKRESPHRRGLNKKKPLRLFVKKEENGASIYS